MLHVPSMLCVFMCQGMLGELALCNYCCREPGLCKRHFEPLLSSLLSLYPGVAHLEPLATVQATFSSATHAGSHGGFTVFYPSVPSVLKLEPSSATALQGPPAISPAQTPALCTELMCRSYLLQKQSCINS